MNLIEDFMNKSEAQILEYISSPSAKDSDRLNLGAYTMLAGSYIQGSDLVDSVTFNGPVHNFMRTGGPMFFEMYTGNDYLDITPMSNSTKAFYGGGQHTYYARLGPGDDIITGRTSVDAPLKAYALGGDGFDYILEDLSTPGWSLTRPYNDSTVVSNTLEGVEWNIGDDVEAIGSGNKWYLTKDMAQNKFIPLTWNEVLAGGKTDPVISPRRNRGNNKRGKTRRIRSSK